MNAHFSSVGDEPSKTQYEHGIQVIDGDKEFKYVLCCGAAAPICQDAC